MNFNILKHIIYRIASLFLCLILIIIYIFIGILYIFGMTIRQIKKTIKTIKNEK